MKKILKKKKEKKRKKKKRKKTRPRIQSMNEITCLSFSLSFTHYGPWSSTRKMGR